MRQRWMTEREIKHRYDRRIQTVGFGDAYLAALPEGTPHSFWAFGGDFDLKPEELEQKVIDAYLSQIGEFQDSALKLYMAEKQPFVLTEASSGEKVPFKYAVGLTHTYGFSSFDNEDIEQLREIGAAIPECRSGLYFAAFLPLASPGVVPGLNSILYKGTTVGNLREPRLDAEGRGEFLRVVARSPSPA